MTVSFVRTACLNMLFLIARYPLSGALLKKCLLAFALTAPVAACGKALYSLFSGFLSAVPAMLLSGVCTLATNLLLWIAFRLFPVKKVKKTLF